MVRLRRPNQFVGLEGTTPTRVPPPKLIYPNLLSQINEADPARAYGDDPVKFANWEGLVGPEDRPFKVMRGVCTACFASPTLQIVQILT